MKRGKGKGSVEGTAGVDSLDQPSCDLVVYLCESSESPVETVAAPPRVFLRGNGKGSY